VSGLLHGALRGRRGGFTLIEVILTVSTLALVFSAVGLFRSRSQDQTRASLARDQAESIARRTVDRVAEELRGVGQTLLNPDPTSALGTSTITYQKPTGVSGMGGILWGNPSRLELQLEPGETDDGVDEDGDGLVDERRLVLVRDVATPDEATVVLCKGLAELGDGEQSNGLDDDGDGLVDEAGFAVRRVGDLLTIQITAIAPAGDGGTAVTGIVTHVSLRN
jgi:type II secretory pathway pseudopilin PulG